MFIADSLVVIGMAVASLGTIHEADGPRSHTFWLRNLSTDTLEVVGGYTSCGCTTISCTPDDFVSPGDSVEVELHFNPRGKGGEFFESGTVLYRPKDHAESSRPRRVQMALTGVCMTSEETLLRQFPIAIDNHLRLSRARFDLGRMHVGDTRERSVVVLHLGDLRQELIPLKFTVTPDMPHGLQQIERRVSVGNTTFTIIFDVLIL